MKYLFLVLLFAITGCFENREHVLSKEQILNISTTCQSNGGLVVVSVNHDKYLARCNNKNNVPSGMSSFVINQTILSSEIENCQKSCETNLGIKYIETRYVCTKSIGYRLSNCVKAENEVKCSCQNNVFTIYKHEVPVGYDETIDYYTR